MAPKPPLSTERLYKREQAKKKQEIYKGGAKNQALASRRRFLKFLGLGAAGLSAVGVAYPATRRVLGFFKKRKAERVNKELAFLNQNSFGSPALRREWARISLEFEEHLGKSELPKKLDYLRMVEHILPQAKGLTPIDIVRTINLNEPTRENATFIRNKIDGEKKTLSSHAIYSTQPRLREELESEIKRLENVATICETVADMGAQGRALAGAIDRVPKDVWNDILKDRKKGTL